MHVVGEIPAFLYDHLRASAKKYGGIGSGLTYTYDPDYNPEAPHCVWGHAAYDRGARIVPWADPQGELEYALIDAGITPHINDQAVAGIRTQVRNAGDWSRGYNYFRATWPEYCAELSITRGA
jgi:hypothetical protein